MPAAPPQIVVEIAKKASKKNRAKKLRSNQKPN